MCRTCCVKLERPCKLKSHNQLNINNFLNTPTSACEHLNLFLKESHTSDSNLINIHRELLKHANNLNLEPVGNIPRDGNCLFHAVATHLNNAAPSIYPFTQADIRRTVVDWLQNNPYNENADHWSDFIFNMDWYDYLDRISDSEWGDHVCLVAISRVFMLNIEIVSSSSEMSRNVHRITSEHPHTSTLYLGHEHEQHYILLSPVTQEDSAIQLPTSTVTTEDSIISTGAVRRSLDSEHTENDAPSDISLSPLASPTSEKSHLDNNSLSPSASAHSSYLDSPNAISENGSMSPAWDEDDTLEVARNLQASRATTDGGGSVQQIDQEAFCTGLGLTTTLTSEAVPSHTHRLRREIRRPARYTPSEYINKRRRRIEPASPSGTGFDSLPQHIKTLILSFAIANNILMINVLRQVSKSVRAALDTCSSSMEQVYMNNFAMDALFGQKNLEMGHRSIFAVRTIGKKCGRLSGLFLRLKEILKKSTSKWFNAYIVLQYDGDRRHGWFRIVELYFKKKC
ncbi:MAG: hypothetical protein ABW185_01730 [Sedimenticola sp.]